MQTVLQYRRDTILPSQVLRRCIADPSVAEDVQRYPQVTAGEYRMVGYYVNFAVKCVKSNDVTKMIAFKHP